MIINRIWFHNSKFSVYSYRLSDKIEVLGKVSFPMLDPISVAIGGFDGFHLGHQKILHELGYDLPRSIFTFYPLPKFYFHRKPHFHIYTLREKLELAKKYRIDYFNIFVFTEEFSQIEPEEFLDLLASNFNIKKIVVGSNFRFGKGRKGGVKILKQFFARKDIETCVLLPVKIDGEVVSSSKIREKIRGGKLEEAARFLGKPFFISGKVIQGKKIARGLGYPTANLRVPLYKILPPLGVYYSRTWIGEKAYPSISYLGTAPTMGKRGILLETFIANLNNYLYNENIRVELFHFKRKERKFAGVEELKKSIERDIETWRAQIE